MNQNSAVQHEMSRHFEAIRNVKARYFRYLDSKAWDKLRGVLTANANFDGFPFESRSAAEFVSNLSEYFVDIDSVHHGHTPLLSAIDTSTIRGVWTMHDYLVWPADSRSYRGEFIPGLTGIRGYGVYEDEYRLVGEQWKISRTRLVRTRVELVTEKLNLLPLEGTWAEVDPHWIK